MALQFFLAAAFLLFFGSASADPSSLDHSWTVSNCHKSEIVVDRTKNYTSDQILLDATGTPTTDVYGSGQHCFAVKRFSEDRLAFVNYGIGVAMLHVQSNDDNTETTLGNPGLIFNYENEFHYEYLYISYDNTTVPPTTGVPPASVSENATSTTGGTDEAYQGFFFQAGYRFKGLFTNTITIPLNGTINTNVWHDLRLVIDKDSNNTIEIFFDDKYVGSFIEFLPPRDVGGVMTVNRDIALFKNFEVGQCLRFDSFGNCIERSNICPDEYTLINEKCFYITNKTDTYIDAITQCKLKNGRLYEPRDEADYYKLVNYLTDVLGYQTSTSSRNPYRTWLGISDRKEEGRFVYESDGTDVQYTHWYTNYGIDRGVLDTRYECAYMFHASSYQWVTTYCDQSHVYYQFRYICEANFD